MKTTSQPIACRLCRGAGRTVTTACCPDCDGHGDDPCLECERWTSDLRPTTDGPQRNVCAACEARVAMCVCGDELAVATVDGIRLGEMCLDAARPVTSTRHVALSATA